MKKIMIALAAVAMTVAAQAATASWSCTKVYNGNDTDLGTGVAYFLTTSMAATDSWASLNGADAFKTALSGVYSFTPSEAGKYSVASSAAVANETLGLTAGTSYTAYLLIFDTAEITDASQYYVTSTKPFTAVSGTSNANITLGSQAANSQVAANWTAVATAVPEPTSGLLLLLGMAGLALKRKRA